jgi:hypothetical protein
MQVGKPASLRMPSEDMVWEILRSGLGKSIGCFSSFRLSAGRSMNTRVRPPPKKVGMVGGPFLKVPKHVECWQLELFHSERGSLAAVRSVLPERQRGLYRQTRECERCQSAKAPQAQRWGDQADLGHAVGSALGRRAGEAVGQRGGKRGAGRGRDGG